MKSIVKNIFLIIIFLTLVVTGVSAQKSNVLLEKGINLFSLGKYDESLTCFRDIVIDSNQKIFHSDAYFWIAKSYIALRQFDNAEENLEFFIINFPANKYYEEALYQKGRLLFLQDDYENCIQESQNFVDKYPNSPFAANAFFWAAESLYQLGQLEDAERIYTHIIYNYPASFKVEVANYRLSMIEQKYREESLVELLKLTHEEYLKSIEEFQVREKTYENALDSYQKKLSLTNTDASGNSDQKFSLELLDLQTTVRNKDNEIMALKRKIAELEYRLTNAETKVVEAEKAAKVIEVNPEQQDTKKAEAVTDTSGPEAQLSTDDKLKLLEIKSRAQEIKSFYLQYLGSVGK